MSEQTKEDKQIVQGITKLFEEKPDWLEKLEQDSKRYGEAREKSETIYDLKIFDVQEHAFSVFGRILTPEELDEFMDCYYEYIYPAIQDCIRAVMKE